MRLRYHKERIFCSSEDVGWWAQKQRSLGFRYFYNKKVLAVVGNKIDRTEEEAISYN